jgi:hypothetical protein
MVLPLVEAAPACMVVGRLGLGAALSGNGEPCGEETSGRRGRSEGREPGRCPRTAIEGEARSLGQR